MTGSGTIYPPIIVIGMHRSGTSMVCRMLDRLGLFVGEEKDPNHEAMLFLELNGWLLAQSSAAWDNPELFDYLLADQGVRDLAVDYLRYILSTPWLKSYLGWSRYVTHPDPWRWQFAWGWKDPRNTFTLPLWLQLFPNARVIHVRRHGVDVARSLKRRRDKKFSAGAAHYRRMRSQFGPMYWLRRKQSGFGGSMRCATLEGGLSLWESYIRRAEQHVCALGDQAIELCFEELLESPTAQLEALCDFCGLDPSAETIAEVAHDAEASRAYAFAQHSNMRGFARKHESRLHAFGYNHKGAIASGKNP